MNWEAIGAISETVGAIAVVITLIYLALQIRQANRISRYSAENDFRSQFIDINSTFIEHADLYAMLQDNAEDLTPSDSAKALYMARGLMNAWWAAESAYNYGLLSEASFEVNLNDVSIAAREAPGLLPYFAYVYYAHGADGEASHIAERVGEVLRDAGLGRESDKVYDPARRD